VPRREPAAGLAAVFRSSRRRTPVPQSARPSGSSAYRRLAPRKACGAKLLPTRRLRVGVPGRSNCGSAAPPADPPACTAAVVPAPSPRSLSPRRSVRSQPAPTRARSTPRSGRHRSPIADWLREKRTEPNCYPPVVFEPECPAGSNCGSAAPPADPPAASAAAVIELSPAACLHGEACGANLLPPARVYAVVAIGTFPPSQIGSAQAARRTAPARARSSPPRWPHPSIPQGRGVRPGACGRERPASGPPGRPPQSPTHPPNLDFPHPGLAPCRGIPELPPPTARELPTPGSGGGGANAGRGFR
jgi:hypothetical protein